MLVEGAKDSKMDKIRTALYFGATHYSAAMNEAACRGHKEMMLNLGANNYEWTMIMAAGCGHKEIVQIILNIINIRFCL